MKWIALGLIIIGYIIYFGFSVKIQEPFNFPKNWSFSKIIKEKIFSNNTGITTKHILISNL
jgi:hypothetical protein